MLWDLAAGMAVGFSLAAPPGPMNAIIATVSAARGPREGIRVGLAAPLVDTAYLVLFVAGLGRLVDLEAVLPWASAAGAALLAYFAVLTARATLGAATGQLSFRRVLVLSAANPYQLAWWGSGGTVLMASAGAWGVAGFLATIFAWVVVWATLMAQGRRWEGFTAFVTVASADVLVVYALRLAANAI